MFEVDLTVKMHIYVLFREVHRVRQSGVTIAINWWFEMCFGKDWVYKELCFTLNTSRTIDTAEGNGDKNENILQ